MIVTVSPDRLVVDLGAPHRCLSSAVLGGGLASVRTWVNLQVPADYARLDPAAHLAEATERHAQPVLGMLTAADVSRYQAVRSGTAQVVATVGLGIPLAAAGDDAPGKPAGPHGSGTINILVVVSEPLTDAALAGALQTAVEAKVQALVDAGVAATNRAGWATGTATDALGVACPPGAGVAFAGPATPVGADIARAVHRAVLQGVEAWNNRP